MKHNGEVLSRIPQLDGIRGLAVSMVVLDHASYLYQNPPEQVLLHGTAHGFTRALLSLTAQGWLGVELFFILSGYLITSILLKTRGANSYFTSFYARRVLRIFPVFWLTLLALAFIFPHGPHSFFLIGILFLANVSSWFGVPGLYYPLWSLCVEEHFYLVWPFVVRTFRKRVLLGICVAICVAEPILRAVVAWKMGPSFFDKAWYFSGFRFEGLAYGAILALVAPEFSAREKKVLGSAAMLCGIGIFAAAVPLGVLRSSSSTLALAVHASAGLTFASVLFFGLVCFALGLGEREAKVFANAPLILLGDLSYCLYLVHQMVFWGWDHWLGALRMGSFAARPLAYFLVRLAVCFAISILIALLSRKFVERPILSLKRYFPANRKTKPVEQTLQPA
jgi:peptidoglycan/LPS O-acetylase OafA/YrhL